MGHEFCSACGKATAHKIFYEKSDRKQQCEVCGYTK